MTPQNGTLAAVATFAAISWLVPFAQAQQSAALFDAPMVMFDENTSIRKLADVDGDGRPEALGWWYENNGQNSVYASIYRQTAAGTWSLAWRNVLPTSLGYHREPVLEVGRFDGNARLDWAISLRADLRVYTSRSDGTPELLWRTTQSDPIDRILALDWNSDGLDDLAVAMPTTLQLWRNDGGSFKLTGEFALPSVGGPFECERGDVDGDAIPDLLYSDRLALRMFTVRDERPVLQLTVAHGLNEVRPASGDIDGDGDRDVVLFGKGPDRYVVLRRTGPETFVQEAAVAGGPARYLVDVDGDGDLDGVCCGGGGPYPMPNKTASTFRVALFANGAFAPSIAIPGMGSERLAAAVDVDGDGDVDLVAGRCIYYARGPITRDPYGHSNTVFVAMRSYDVEGDGDVDLDLRSGAVLRNSANGTFATEPLQYPPPPAGTTWEQGGFFGDFDGDGDVDVIVRHLQGTQLLSMRLLRNCGGAFTDGGPAGPAGVDFHPIREWHSDHFSSVVADLDRDGDQDLITFTRDGATTHFTLLWRNDGTGAFTPAGRIDGSVPNAVADLDGDGWPDLLMAIPFSYSAGYLGWCRRTGDFAFAAWSTFGPTVAAHPFNDHVEVVDLDGDGDQDVLGGTFGTQDTRTSVLLNQGGGVFQQVSGLPPTEGLNAVRRAWLRDIDGNGVRDLAVGQAQHSLGTLYFRGSTNGGFSPMVHQIVTPVALLDVDGDGDLDAIHSDGSIVRCIAIDGPSAGSVRQYGSGHPGSGGITPALGATGPMREGVLTEKRLVGAVGGTAAVWVLGLQPLNVTDTPFPGMTLLVAPVGIATGVPIGGSRGTPGAGSWTFPYLVPAAAAGITLYEQFFVIDPGATHGLSASNGLEMRFGPAR